MIKLTGDQLFDVLDALKRSLALAKEIGTDSDMEQIRRAEEILINVPFVTDTMRAA